MKINMYIKCGSGFEHAMERRTKESLSEINLRSEFIGKVEGQGKELITALWFWKWVGENQSLQWHAQRYNEPAEEERAGVEDEEKQMEKNKNNIIIVIIVNIYWTLTRCQEHCFICISSNILACEFSQQD